MTSTSNFFDIVLFLLQVSYWSKFHVNIVRGSGIMTIFFYKGLTRKPEIGNTHVWVFPNIWRLGQVMDTKFGTNVSNKMGLNARKFQYYSFYHFWVIKGKPTGGLKLPPPTLGLMNKRDNRDNKTERVIPLFGAILIKHLAQANQKMLVSFYQITYFKILKQYFLTVKLSKIFLILSNV